MPDRSRSKRVVWIYITLVLVTDAALTVVNYTVGGSVAQDAILGASLTFAWGGVFVAMRQRRDRGRDA